MSCDKKYGPYGSRKRKFIGNRFTKGKGAVGNRSRSSKQSDVNNSSNSILSIDLDLGTSDTLDIDCDQEDTPTRSEQKIQDMYGLIFETNTELDTEEETVHENGSSEDEEVSATYDHVDIENPAGNRIIDIAILGDIISAHLVCRHCHSAVRLCEIDRKGLASTFSFHCNNKNCDRQPVFSSSPQVAVGNSFVNTVNRRTAFAMRSIGADKSELETFCGVMDLPKPVGESSYRAIKKNNS